MAALLIPPINPNAKTIIDLDQGQQIIIDIDTHFGRVRSRLNDPNPATAINIEPSGTCWSFTLEDGVWWRNEYVGDEQRRPQLQKKVRATEDERIGRERARREWEERTRGSTSSNPSGVPSNAQPHPSHHDQTSRVPGPGLHRQNEQSFPIPQAANFVHIQQNAHPNSLPTPPFFPANTTNHTPNFGPPPPVMPHQGWIPPQPPSFPPGFPFNNDLPSNPGPSSHRFPTPHSQGPSDPPYYSSRSSQRPMPNPNFEVNDGNYMQRDGNVRNLYVNQSANVTGNNNNVNWMW